VSSYPVPDAAVPVSAGVIVAVPAELLAWPLKSGRDLGQAGRSALVVGGTGKIRTGGATERPVRDPIEAVTLTLEFRP
jgi:hypothetical protein